MRILVLLALAGCGTSDGSAPSTFDPAAVPTGIYHLTAESQHDSCSPTVALRSGDVPVFASDKGLASFEIEAGGNENGYVLPVDGGYASHSSIDLCAPGSGTVTTDVTLAAADAHALEVDLDRTYVVAAGCSGAPQAGCHASAVLRYELVDACPQACVSRAPTPTCTCH